ncbi:hypothetical protein FRB98_009358 [Tulasnella sp. 332]|nr:hypothetical protein FRB98_009358 [Tulasnella sp. 332]
MATPGSQATTPSPQLSSSSHSTLDATSSSRKRDSPDEHESEPSPNMDNFLKRAHYGKVRDTVPANVKSEDALARELRARLSYATFKTSHNVSHLPLTTLEQKYGAKPPLTFPQASSSSSSSNHQNPLSPRTRTHSQLMPPPVSSPRNNASLYSTLLGSSGPMPPTKRAKHAPSPSYQSSSLSHRINPLSPQSMPLHGGRSIHNRHRSTGQINDHDDISAAATLTNLLLTRPGGSSVSDGRGSSLSRSSSSASVTAFQPSQQSQTTHVSSSQQGPSFSSYNRLDADPASSSSQGRGRPKTPQPDDAQAAELMLFLATSPSPRPSVSSTGGGGGRARSESRPGQLLSKARVLFGSTDNDADMVGNSVVASSSRGSATPTGPSTNSSVLPLGHALAPSVSGSSGVGGPTLLPSPASPVSFPSKTMGSRDVFDIGDFINTSPFPPSPHTSRPVMRVESRSLFGDDDHHPPHRQAHGHSRTGSLLSGMASLSSGVGTASSVRHKSADAPGMRGPVLGPAMEANV